MSSAALPTRWLRLLTGGVGLAAVALTEPSGLLADLAVLIGAVAALATAGFPTTVAPWGVLLATVLPRFADPTAAVDVEVIAQAVLLLLFQAASGLTAAVAAAETVEWRALLPTAYRAGAVLLAMLPAALLAVTAPAVPLIAATGLAAISGDPAARSRSPVGWTSTPQQGRSRSRHGQDGHGQEGRDGAAGW